MLFRRRGARVRGEEGGAMDGRWIYLESISGEGIRAFGLPFQKPCLYGLVSVSGRQRKKTAADHVRGKNPKWDLPMRFDLDGTDQIIEFQVMSRGNPLLMQRGKLVGDVKVPVSALLADGGQDGALCHASYQVRTPSGKANGVLSFSYRISFPRADQMRAMPPGGMYPQTVVPVYVMPHHPQQVLQHPQPQQVMPHPQQVGGAYYLAPAPYYPQLSPPPALPPPPYGYRTG